MKWLGSGEGDAIVKAEMDRGPQRTQDDAAVGYVFQRPPDPEFPSFGPKQLRWALGDDSIIDNHDKWKYPVNSKVGTPPNSMSYIGASSTMPGLYDLGQNKSVPSEHLVYMSNQIPGGMHMHPQYLQQPLTPQIQMRQGPIAPAAKKLWGLEAKDAKSLALNHLNHEQVWRDSTWAAPEHAVSASLAMGRRGGFVGGDTGSILSPRGSDNGGLGVKMVEYVLGGSPTNKDNIGLEPRMRALHLVDDKDKDKPQSPKEEVNGQTVQNGQVSEDEKGFNRTPGSRQPSPAEEELTKNGISLDPTVVVMKPQEQLPPHLHHHLPPHLAPHLGVTLTESVNQQFDHFEQPPPAPYDQQPHQYAAPPPQQHQVDSAVLQQQQHNFDVQVSFYSLHLNTAFRYPV
jgi:pumilio RNA-binding family